MTMSDKRKLLILFLVALAVRLAFIVVRGPTTAPVDWADDHQYHAIAGKLVAERQYENPWYPPGYAMFLAAIYTVTGPSALAARVVNALLSALTCVLLFRLGAKVFTRREGWIAAALLAVYPGHAYMAWHVMPETIYTLLLLAAVLLALKVAEHPTLRGGLLVGVTLGCFHIMKSNLYPFPALLMAWFLFATRRVGAFVALVAGFAALALVTPLANSLSPSRRADAMPANAGNTFWTANNPMADGWFIHAEFFPPGQAFIERHGFKERLEKADVFEQSRMYRTLGLLWIREHPGDFAVLCLKKLNNAFGMPTRSTVFTRHPIAARLAHVLTYGWIAALAVAGIVVARRRWREHLLLHLVVASYVMMVLIFYGASRFTLIVMPVLMLFAARAIVAWAERKPGVVVRITGATREEALVRLESAVRDGGRHYFCFCEASLLSNALRDPAVAQAVNGSTATFADGIAVAMLERLPERIPGPSFLLWACEHGVSRGWSHFFYGGAPGVAEKLAAELSSRYPGLRVAGTFCPPFRELTPEEEADVARRVRGADLMWIALGSPRQELWAAQHCGKLDVPVLLPVGAAFDFHSGARPWAPSWVRRIGMEWAWRMFTGGGRTFRRNVRCVSIVGMHLLKEAFK
jgi:N-acetylglucosaminyldiphosphoundecaprenol N-acetyl-beta-D-mannosaminyltransferase